MDHIIHRPSLSWYNKCVMLTARRISAYFWPHSLLTIHFIFLLQQEHKRLVTPRVQNYNEQELRSCTATNPGSQKHITTLTWLVCVCVSDEQWCLCMSTNKPENITKSKSTGQSSPSALCPRSTALNWDVSYHRLKFLTDSGEILELVWGTNGMFAAQVSAPWGCWADGVCLHDASASQ